MRTLNTTPHDEFQRCGKALPLPGSLNDLTVLRYAHIYRERSSGGVEQYLRLLNRGLLERNRLTILQMHLVRDSSCGTIDEERVGFGRILWVPVPVLQAQPSLSRLAREMARTYSRVRREISNAQHGTVPLPHSGLSRHWVALLRYKWAILSDGLSCLLGTHRVDLLALHWLTYDTDGLISIAMGAGIPFVLINHFENARLDLPQMRRWIPSAAAIGGVSDKGVPDALSDRYTNLSDAVDTDFFSPAMTGPPDRPTRPVILLPARVGASKGHWDMVEAARILAARKVDFQLYFAGAVESESLRRELCQSIAILGRQERIAFLGEIRAEEMRDWYGRSTVVVLPSHSEGLPRVLLEAQAMEKPVVAYDCGGTGEAVLPGETGLLVKKSNIQDLADKIHLLLRDEPRRRRMGELGRQFVSQRFGVSALVERHERFYLSALSAAPAGCI